MFVEANCKTVSKEILFVSDIDRYKDTAIQKKSKQIQNNGQLFSFKNVRSCPTVNSVTTRKHSNKRDLEMSLESAPETLVQ